MIPPGPLRARGAARRGVIARGVLALEPTERLPPVNPGNCAKKNRLICQIRFYRVKLYTLDAGPLRARGTAKGGVIVRGLFELEAAERLLRAPPDRSLQPGRVFVGVLSGTGGGGVDLHLRAFMHTA